MLYKIITFAALCASVSTAIPMDARVLSAEVHEQMLDCKNDPHVDWVSPRDPTYCTCERGYSAERTGRTTSACVKDPPPRARCGRNEVPDGKGGCECDRSSAPDARGNCIPCGDNEVKSGDKCVCEGPKRGAPNGFKKYITPRGTTTACLKVPSCATDGSEKDVMGDCECSDGYERVSRDECALPKARASCPPDDMRWTDSYGDTCSWYNTPARCNQWGHLGANDNCQTSCNSC